jgi:hypothetical protein
MKKRTKPTPKRQAKPKPPRVRAAPSALQRIDAKLESLCELVVHVGTLATHCERLLREKETLHQTVIRLTDDGFVHDFNGNRIRPLNPSIEQLSANVYRCKECGQLWDFETDARSHDIRHACPGKPYPMAPLDTANTFIATPKRQAG